MAVVKKNTIRVIVFIILVSLLTCVFAAPVEAAAKIKTQKAADKLVAQGGIRGIDVSKWQGKINWAKVAKDDVAFAMIRATYGAEADPYFVTNATQANENGLYVGAYHYARFKDRASMKKEAEAFLKQLDKVKITYPVVLDLEQNSGGLKKSSLTTLSIEFMDIIKSKGYKVMLYSYQNFFTKSLNLSKLKDYDLWVANYLEAPKGIDHVMWQHTSAGKVSGISGNVDINIAYQSLAVKRTSGTSSPASTMVKVLNEWYGNSFDKDNLDYNDVHFAISCAFQEEINRQLGGDLMLDGMLDDDAAQQLSSIPFKANETKGRITTLIQCVLYLENEYIDSINGVYDDTMIEALEVFQANYGIKQTGQMDLDTWYKILQIY